jgi:hypothetical protein
MIQLTAAAVAVVIVGGASVAIGAATAGSPHVTAARDSLSSQSASASASASVSASRSATAEASASSSASKGSRTASVAEIVMSSISPSANAPGSTSAAGGAGHVSPPPSSAQSQAATGPTALAIYATGAVTAQDGQCFDDRGALSTAGNPVQTFTCNGNPSQQWTFDAASGQVRVFSQCLTADSAYAAPVVIAPCGGGTGQQWVARSDGSLVNSQSGQCLTEQFPPVSGGTPVYVARCAADPYQHWVFP